jgi:intracellular multiplication protein IcmE
MNSINSDEPGPVLAKIVDGGIFEGAQLIGGFETNKESVTLTFSTLTMGNTVYDIGAVAVDLSDSGTTLADDVDKHIVERYGSLALASFVEGYANALTSTTVIVAGDGATTTATGSAPDSDDQLKIALGTVGATFVPVLQENFDRPTTIKVSGGRAIGVLFLKPFNLNKNN